MLFLLSPAKTLDYETDTPPETLALSTEPAFTAQADELVALLRRKTAADIADLMDLSPALAELNVARYARWQPSHTPGNSKPAVLAFNGDVYDGLKAATLHETQLLWAQSHLVLLSGLYGALRPLDLLQPYRLEMGTALANPAGRDLYAFWGDTVAAYLNQRQEEELAPVVVNLASQEYSRVALRPALRASVVECVFEDWTADRYKVISFYAKRARGLMARWAIENRVSSPAQLLAFCEDGYRFHSELSHEGKLVFRRRLGG